MANEVIPYASKPATRETRGRIAHVVIAWTVASLVGMAQFVPTSLGMGHGPTSIVSSQTYGWLGTWLEVRHTSYLTKPATVTWTIKGWGLPGNLAALVGIWAACFLYGKGEFQRSKWWVGQT